MTRQMLCFSRRAWLLSSLIGACGGRTANDWPQAADGEFGGMTGGITSSAIGGALGAGGSSATAAGGSFDFATGGSFGGTGGSGASNGLIPVASQVPLGSPPCGPDSFLKITAADAAGCSVPVPLLPGGCSGEKWLADPGLINIYLNRDDGSFLVLRSSSGCAVHGWELDAGGATITLCPETCDAVLRDSAEVIAVFGCVSVLCIY